MAAAVILAIVLALILTGVSLRYRVTLLHAAENRTTRLSLLLAEQAARTFASVDFTLRGFEPLLDPRQPLNVRDLDGLLRKRASELDYVQIIHVLDPEGRVLATSSTSPHDTSPRRDDCVTRLSQAGAAPLAIGCDRGDVGMAGQPAIAVARRLGETSDAQARFIVADVDPGYFSRFFRDLDLGSHALVTLTEDHGHVLLASAEPDGAARALIPPTQQARLEQLQRASRDKITAVHATDGYPLSVLVAVDRGEINRQWRQAMTPAALLTAAVDGLLILLARTIARHRAERELARQRAVAAQKLEAMGQMTASVAHDFRNILTVMAGTLRLIRRRGAEEVILAEADGTVQRGNAIVDRLLAFSRRTDIRPEPHDINELLRHLEATLRHIAGPRSSLVLELGDGLLPCLVDRVQFEAALMNLVNNAGQAMGAGGIVTVRSRPGVDQAGNLILATPGVAVAVADTGCGIDGPTLKRVFEPFFTTKTEGGTGLGLAQVQACVEQVGGAVTVDSRVGVGTTFTLHLPRAAVRDSTPAVRPVLTLDPA